ncbi:MAG: PQQ-binding-like beta-propeller repeat protein [Ignavibacteria bacterium]|jgi:outer membrane protein assembly factor BamB
MKKILLIFIAIASLNLANGYKFAIVTNPTTSNQKSIQNADSIITFINSIDDLSFVVFNGNLTQWGETEEVNTLQQSLQKLSFPFYVLPGYRDLKWNKTAGLNFKDNFDEFYFLHEADSTIYVGINCNLPWISNNHIPIESIYWLKNELENYTEEFEFIIILNNNRNLKIDNLDSLLSLFQSKKLSAIFSVSKLDAGSIPSFTISLGKPNQISISLIDIKPDSIFYQSINPGSSNTKKQKVSKPQAGYNFKPSITKVDTGINVIWQYDFISTIYNNATIYNNYFYFADYSGIISCIDTMGNLIWDYDAFGNIVTKPTIADNILAVATLQGDLVTLNAITGESIQTIGFDESITFGLVKGFYKGTKKLMIPTESKSVVYFGTNAGKVYCYVLETLEKVWENESAKNLIALTPEITGNKFSYTSMDGYLYCIDSNEGWLIWKSKINTDKNYSPAFSKLAVSADNIFVNDLSGKNYKIDFNLGLKNWEADKYGANESIGISAIGHRVYIKDTGKNYFNIVSAKTGNWVKQGKINLNDDEFPNKPVDWNGNVLFTSSNGSLYLIDAKFKDKIIYKFDNSPYHTIQNYKDNLFLNTSLDGKIYFYKIREDY